jgi:uncharacterized RDD family membrane protein YckC
MARSPDRTANRSQTSDRIVDFAPERIRAPFSLRCVAVFIDYIVAIAAPVLGLVFELLIGADPAKSLTGTAWSIAILLGISDLIIFPALSGQTLGMMIAGLRIVRSDGRDASVGRIILRNTLGYLVTCLTGGIGFLLAAFTPRGRALHDYVGGTLVIFAKRNILK